MLYVEKTERLDYFRSPFSIESVKDIVWIYCEEKGGEDNRNQL